jgi:uncharacterized membrane protein
MIEFENTVLIERPVEEVFSFVSNFENVPLWNYYVTDVRRTDDSSLDVGATFHQVRKSDQQRYRITAYEPDRQVVVETLPGSSPEFEMRFTFTEESGVTHLSDAWRLDLGMNPLLERLGQRKVKSAVAENLSKLKELLETGSARLQDGRVSRL